MKIINIKNNKFVQNNKFFRLIIKFIILLIYSLFFDKSYNINRKYIDCLECIKKNYNFESKCLDCSSEILFKDLFIISKEETLKEIIRHKRSISRYGDGEFSIIFGESINFQNFDRNLSKRLIDILNSNEKNLLIGIFLPYKKKELNLFRDSVSKFWIDWLSGYKFRLLKILNKNKKYYSSEITRFYSNLKDKSEVPKFIKKLRKIWEGRDLLIIEGDKSRNGIGNNLFNNSKSIKRIICPNKNAFKVYDKILNASLKINKNILILISLGPTATVLAYDLNRYGYQAIDIGHIDIQYEFYLRNATKTIQIPFKFVNEFNGGKNENVGNISDMEYYHQIITKITH
jgi:glycosyltransferase family protein